MRLLVRLAIFFYVVLLMIIGVTGLLLLAHLIDLKTVLDFTTFIYTDRQAGMLAAAVVALSLIISLALAQIIYGRQEQEGIISFDNPLGKVTISLTALEDLVRRMVVLTPQIKEIRPSIVSGKRGLKIDVRLVLGADANIPELTAELQDMIKRRVQEVVGSEERVVIRVHVIKIVADFTRTSKTSARDLIEEQSSRSLPFPGYKV